MFELFTWRK